MVEGGVVNADKDMAAKGWKGITNAVEDVIVARDILLAKKDRSELHLCHCSTKGQSVRHGEQAAKMTAWTFPLRFAPITLPPPQIFREMTPTTR